MLVLESLENHNVKENHILFYWSEKFILLSWYISFQSPLPPLCVVYISFKFCFSYL